MLTSTLTPSLTQLVIRTNSRKKVIGGSHYHIRTKCQAQMAQKRNIIEHVTLWKMKQPFEEEAESIMLDSLYTVKYHYRNVIALSLGRLTTESQGYTHGLLTRFPNKSSLVEFLGHQGYNSVLNDYVNPFCEGMLEVSFESEVEDDIEAIFRTGERFESGIERVVLFKIRDNSTSEGKYEIVKSFLKLSDAIEEGLEQITAGENFSQASHGFSHVVSARFSTDEDVEVYDHHPAHKEVMLDKVIPVCEEMLVAEFRVDPVGTAVR